MGIEEAAKAAIQSRRIHEIQIRTAAASPSRQEPEGRTIHPAKAGRRRAARKPPPAPRPPSSAKKTKKAPGTASAAGHRHPPRAPFGNPAHADANIAAGGAAREKSTDAAAMSAMAGT